LGAILGDVRVQLALATLTISQFVMISTTSTSPVYLHDQGYGVQTIGLAVSLHLGGMYVASPLSGWLCDRVGRLPMIGVGAMVLMGALGTAAGGRILGGWGFAGLDAFGATLGPGPLAATLLSRPAEQRRAVG